jgi:predicted flap endonuclease-1-like 5' DNA nuclease
MGYHIDFSKLDLPYLEKRLMGVEPIPSQRPLTEGLGLRLAALRKAGMRTLEDVSSALKTPKGRTELARISGIDMDYLDLMRRFLAGLRPKPHALSAFTGIASKAVKALSAKGIDDTAALYEAALEKKERSALARETGIAPADLAEIVELSSLCRIQWVGPSYARLLREAGYADPAKIASAEPEALRAGVSAANARLGLSRVEIGLKDSARLVALAGFLAREGLGFPFPSPGSAPRDPEPHENR